MELTLEEKQLLIVAILDLNNKIYDQIEEIEEYESENQTKYENQERKEKLLKNQKLGNELLLKIGG